MMARRLWMLFRREVAADRSAVLLIAGLIVGWDLFLLTRVGRWPGSLPEVLSVFSLFIAVPWSVIASLQTWHREWQQGSAHYTLAFPVPGWALVLAKALASVAGTGLLALTAAAAGFPIYGRSTAGQIGAMGKGTFAWIAATNVLKLGIFFGTFLFALSVIVQWAYLMGRAAQTWRGFVVPLAGLSGLWLAVRAGVALNPGLQRLPPMAYLIVQPMGRYCRVFEVYALLISTGPLFSVALCALAFWGLASWLTERQVDA